MSEEDKTKEDKSKEDLEAFEEASKAGSQEQNL